MKQVIAPAIVVAGVLVSGSTLPATAGDTYRSHYSDWRSAHAQYLPMRPRASYRDPDGVYWGNKLIGRDPDPNVRRSVQQEWFDTHER